MEAVIFIGIQGSGKTSFYRQRFLDTHVRVSLDLLNTRHREQVFFQACLDSGQRFVVDNTNLTVADRARYIGPAKAAEFRVIGYWFESELREALRRNKQRAGEAEVPVAAVVSALKRLEPPALKEGFDELYVVSRDENDQFIVSARSGEEPAARKPR